MLVPKFVSKTWNEFLHNSGRRSEAEYLVKSLKPQFQAEAFNRLVELNSLQTVADPNLYYQKSIEFGKFLERTGGLDINQNNKSFIIRGSADLFGYRPAGTRIWNYFANPFGVFGYVSEQYPAVRMCIDLIRQTLEGDGFYLVADDGVSPKRLMEVYEILNELKLDFLRTEMICHLQIYGNTWLRPIKKGVGAFKKLKELKLLFPTRLLPVFERTTETIIEWEYIQGRIRSIYGKDDLLHLMLPSLQSDQIGSPPLVSAITKIETAITAMQLNNTIFQKGGLLGVIVALEPPKDDNVLTTSHSSTWVQEVQAQLDYMASGNKAAQGIIAMPNVKNVHTVTKIGELDANWKAGEEETKKTVAQLLGVPSEKIGIPRSTHAQYQPELVENVINAQYDATIHRLTTKVDKFLNYKLMKELLKIYDVKIIPSGRYGALTLTAAQTILALAQAGPLITINQAFERILGWEPLPIDNPRGQQVLDISAVRTIKEGETVLPVVIAPIEDDPELSSAKSIQNLDRIIKDPSCWKIKVGGNIDDNGRLFKGNQKIKF